LTEFYFDENEEHPVVRWEVEPAGQDGRLVISGKSVFGSIEYVVRKRRGTIPVCEHCNRERRRNLHVPAISS
jgi:hypothetical protein